jgi:hypothetical protein
MMTEARTVSVSLERSAAAVYNYLSDPASFPKWSLFITDIRNDGNGWLVTTPNGTVRMTFTSKNEFGVLDHHVTVNPQRRVYVPMRVVSNGDGSEVLFTVFRAAGMSDDEYEKDIAMVRTDLARLKRTLESE